MDGQNVTRVGKKAEEAVWDRETGIKRSYYSLDRNWRKVRNDRYWWSLVSAFVPLFYLLKLVLKIEQSAHSVSVFFVPQGLLKILLFDYQGCYSMMNAAICYHFQKSKCLSCAMFSLWRYFKSGTNLSTFDSNSRQQLKTIRMLKYTNNDKLFQIFGSFTR